jgi:hypothetical protein
MLRRLVVVVGVAALFTAAAVGTAVAQANPCDAALTKLGAKKVKCLDGVIAKGQKKGTPTDSTKIAKCKSKFAAKCTTTGCASPNHTSCTDVENAADAAADSLSPSGAFLNAGGGLF